MKLLSDQKKKDKQFNFSARSTITSGFSFLGKIIQSGFKVIKFILKPVFLLIIVLLFIVFGSGLFGVVAGFVFGMPYLSYFSGSSDFLAVLSWISGMLVIALPFVILLTYLIRLSSSYRLKPKWRSLLMWSWIVSIVVFLSSMMWHVKDYSYQTEINDTTHYPANTDKIVIKMKDHPNRFDSHILSLNDIQINESGFFSDFIRITLHDTDESEISIEKTMYSNGSERKNAIANAKNAVYNINVEDGIITLPKSILIPKGTKFRAQHLHLDIYIPKDKKLEIDKSAKWFGIRNRFNNE